jgi:hypothetical protein
VPLSEGTGQYLMTVRATTFGLEKTKSVEISVVKSTLTDKLDELRGLFDRVKADIAALQATGISTDRLDRLSGEIEALLQKAGLCISGDDKAALEQSLAEMENLLASASAAIFPLKVQGFLNGKKFSIAALAVLGIMILFMLTQVLLPPVLISRQIASLEKKRTEIAQAKKNTQLQYFKRQIDEKTFNSMIARQQAEETTVKVRLNSKRAEKDRPVGANLSAGAMAGWLAGGPRRLAGIFRRKEKKKSRLQEMQAKLAAQGKSS